MKPTHMRGIIAALAAGAVAMYMLDPEMGRRRRALMRNKLESARHDVQRYGRVQTKRALGHLRGAAAQAKSAIGLAALPATDEQISKRVRARLGRLVTRPGAIDVSVEDGHVVLNGHIVASEHTGLVVGVATIDGVRGVDDRLTVYDQPGDIPELQGEGRSG